MNAIDIHAAFWAIDPETGQDLGAPRRLLSALGEDGHVEHNASTGQIHARFTTVSEEGGVIQHARDALDRLLRLALESGLGEPHELAVRVEELVAIGSGHYRRGEFVP